MTTAVQKEKGLSGNILKLIAIIAMTIDHLTWTLYPGFQRVWWIFALHCIGRITAPIMWFFIAEGYHYTHNVKRYLLRLFLFAVVSHFAYAFAFGIPFLPLSTGVFNQTSVLWALSWSVVLMIITDSPRVPIWAKYLAIIAVCLIAFPADWSSIAAITPWFLVQNRGNFKKQMICLMLMTICYALVYVLFIDHLYGLLQLFTFLCIPFLKAYNGTRGRWKGMKWMFYIYYPAHLVVIGLIRILIYGNIPTIF